MIKAFKQESNINNYHELRIFNLETGEFIHYFQDKTIGFTYSNYKTTILKMGYKSTKECIKELKHRNSLGFEIDYKEQRESEKIGLISLGVLRIKRANRVNTEDFEDVIQKLSSYGLGYYDAQNTIIESYKREI